MNVLDMSLNGSLEGIKGLMVSGKLSDTRRKAVEASLHIRVWIGLDRTLYLPKSL